MLVYDWASLYAYKQGYMKEFEGHEDKDMR